MEWYDSVNTLTMASSSSPVIESVRNVRKVRVVTYVTVSAVLKFETRSAYGSLVVQRLSIHKYMS